MPHRVEISTYPFRLRKKENECLQWSTAVQIERSKASTTHVQIGLLLGQKQNKTNSRHTD